MEKKKEHYHICAPNGLPSRILDAFFDTPFPIFNGPQDTKFLDESVDQCIVNRCNKRYCLYWEIAAQNIQNAEAAKKAAQAEEKAATTKQERKIAKQKRRDAEVVLNCATNELISLLLKQRKAEKAADTYWHSFHLRDEELKARRAREIIERGEDKRTTAIANRLVEMDEKYAKLKETKQKKEVKEIKESKESK